MKALRTVDPTMGAVDFEGLVERIRTQSLDASGSDTERVTLRTFDEIDYEAMRELLGALEDEDVDPGECVFYLSPTIADEVVGSSGVGSREELEDRLGRPVRAEEGMPDHSVLFVAPDAIDEDGELVDPSAVACGIVERAD